MCIIVLSTMQNHHIYFCEPRAQDGLCGGHEIEGNQPKTNQKTTIGVSREHRLYFFNPRACTSWYWLVIVLVRLTHKLEKIPDVPKVFAVNFVAVAVQSPPPLQHLPEIVPIASALPETGHNRHPTPVIKNLSSQASVVT